MTWRVRGRGAALRADWIPAYADGVGPAYAGRAAGAGNSSSNSLAGA